MKKKKNKFKNPHYSPRKRLPARRRSPRSFIAKYISTRNCGIAFRVINASELVFAAEAAVNPTDLLDFKSEDTIERVEVVDYDAVGGESTENNAVGGEGTENNADGVESTENNAVGVERRRGELFLESATVSAQLDESEKFFIGKRHTMSAINGDIVRIRVMSGHDAEVTEILQRSVTDVMGIVYQAEDELGETVWVLEPDDKRLDFSVIITEVCEGLSPKDGDKAVARITEYPEYGYSDAEGILIRAYGDAHEKSANYRAILEMNSVITEFSEQALAEAEESSRQPVLPDGRVDLRNSVIFTLDGADAKDLDDAVTVRREGDGFVLGVHIADVSHYVQKGTVLDREAMARGTSIYFADRVVPMLPVSLSNGSCSLNAGVDRYALSAEMTVSSSGEILRTNVFKSVIRSSLRGVYSEFNQLAEGSASPELQAKYAVIPREMLEAALELYSVLKEKSLRRGALELDSEEAAVVLDAEGLPIEIVPRRRGVGEMLIEQFMLCANEGVASWMKERGFPCVYRIHEQPDDEKLSAFITFAYNLGLRPEYIRHGAKLSPAYFSRILDRARERGIGTPVSYMLLRTMMKARYSHACSGHFGLGTSRYCHFTSPIRRYPDLSVHRILSFALQNGDPIRVSEKFSGFAALSARTSSDCELRALKVEREMDELFKALYLSRRVGEVFCATVSSVTAFGLFCRLPNTCEGLVPISTLDGYFSFNENTLSLVSDSRCFRIGDTVTVRVENVDIPSRKVEFLLLDQSFPG